MAMKFTHNGREFSISFSYERREVNSYTPDGNLVTRLSDKPYTTAKLWRRSKQGDLVLKYTATVGCHKNDVFSKQSGRIKALRALTNKLPKSDPQTSKEKALRAALWNAYNTRWDR